MSNVLHPALYAALQARFGTVKIVNQGLRRIEHGSGKDITVVQRGENYVVCCPICGDSKFRLTFSYKFLSKQPMSTRRVTALANCYNEGCDVRSHEFYEPILHDMQAFELGLLVSTHVQAPASAVVAARLEYPTGVVPLSSLPESHEAIQFLKRKYHTSLDYRYLSDCYGVGFAESIDLKYPKAHRRILFPIYQNKELVAWQGRAVDAETLPRWYLPPGFQKCVYNADSIFPTDIPVIAEGITSAIACGPNGVAIFGKTLTDGQAKLIADRWSTALIAIDPETFLLDGRSEAEPVMYAAKMKAHLDRYLASPAKMIRWPKDILDVAARKIAGEDVDVPDPASLGIPFMHKLITEALHVGPGL